MRDIIISLIVFGSLPFILKKPHIGVLMWVWISVMNPHRLSWGFAYSFPFAAIVAATTLASLLITSKEKKPPASGELFVLCAFSAWMVVSTIFSLDPSASYTMLQRVLKIMLMIVVTLTLIRSKEQVHLLIWTLVLSLGYFGVKGGIFTIASGGNFRVWGPEGSFIEGNNELALAIITIMPMLYYLHLESRHKWLNRGLIAAMPLCMLAALGSYSRGALLAIAAMGAFMWMKSPRKAMLGAILALLVPAALLFMPAQWGERMDTIHSYQEDSSAMGRINAWSMTYNLAKDRPLVGGGFEIYDAATFARYAPNPNDIHAAHSVYFQCLGEHGFVGLGLYLLLMLMSWRRANWIIRSTDGRVELAWAGRLARMIQVSMVGFAVGGAFLSLLYFDVPYYLLAILLIVAAHVRQQLPASSAPARLGGVAPGARP
ncbi:putative O-glycosylation ligase, exosortase A system-associated [Janthinobacterium sp.]|uniref:putative O-glycosylation ligase, exosortase A system-associated n=1 Tax=Janthinobacterium sp. TaxID=1871054 RepID=UPI00293D488D|nr:putative O-glycosylation ligase, exosortase A system-associated [Janthinobacterium sp.]